MAFLKVENVKIKGFSAGVPQNVASNMGNHDDTSAGYSVSDFVRTTGVGERRKDGRFTTSDLCVASAERLIEDLNWSKEEIDCIVFVSQTGDYILPATSCIIQDRLGLKRDCMAFDIGLGCSGWVYGMSVLSAMMQTGFIKKAILMCGDTGYVCPEDDMLFGEAGTCTALEYALGAAEMCFNLGTDGSGFDAIRIPHGGARHYFDETSLQKEVIEGHEYTMTQSRMKGMDVFSFGISTAPKSVKKLAAEFGFDYQDADYFVFHQANMMMNKMIDKKLKLPSEKTLYSIDKFGNTSSASIPLTIVTQLADRREELARGVKLICCGFGVGLSWGTAYIELKDIVISNLVELN